MKLILQLLTILFTLSLSLYAQEVKTNKSKTNNVAGSEKVDSPQATGNKVEIKDGTTTLIEINNEGSAGSIMLPSVGSVLTGSKLYSNGVNLFWGNSQLNGSNGATAINDLSDAEYDGSSLFLGEDAGANFNGDATANTAIGKSSLNKNTTGASNTATGFASLINNDVGGGNTATGTSSLLSNLSGDENVATGFLTLFNNLSGENNTAIGSRALFTNTTGKENTAVGFKALYFNKSSWNIAIGSKAMESNTIGTANTSTGTESLNKNTTGNHNTANGYKALLNSETGSFNTATGSSALTNNTVGKSNTANGFRALYNNTTGFRNTAIGVDALYSNTTDSANTAIGYNALYSNNGGGYDNTAIGYLALYSNNYGDANTALGFRALGQNADGHNNTAIGAWALFQNINGSSNTAVGRSTGPTGHNLFNTTCIGFQAITTASNTISLGNRFITSIKGQVGFSTFSDGRYKRNIKEDVIGLDFIKGLRPVTYNIDIELLTDNLHENLTIDENGNKINLQISDEMKSVRLKKSNERNTGFIAQEVEQLANELSFNFSGIDPPANEQSMYSLRYAEFVVPLVKAVQEQQEMISELRLEIEELKKIVEK